MLRQNLALPVGVEMTDTTFAFRVECITHLVKMNEFLAMTTKYAGTTVSIKEMKSNGVCIISTKHPITRKELDLAMYQSYLTKFFELSSCWKTLDCGEEPREK